MSFTDIKTKNQGFTIVELLIVVVVIAILAAITIVSYNGITNRANASAAASTAASFQKKAELYASDPDTSGYPTTLGALTASSASSKPYYVASGSIKVAATPTSTTGKDTIKVEQCGSGAGLKITYYDFTANSLPSTPQITVGVVTGTCTTVTS